jgi:hypothetical protein
MHGSKNVFFAVCKPYAHGFRRGGKTIFHSRGIMAGCRRILQGKTGGMSVKDWPPDVKEKISQWMEATERLHLTEYIQYIDNKKRMLLNNFIGGLARGLGMAVGFTILGAIVVLLLQDLAARNLPVIGGFLAKIVSLVQENLK